MITIPHATEAIRMQGFQTHTAVQPINIQLLQTQQKPRVTEAQHNAEKHSLLTESPDCSFEHQNYGWNLGQWKTEMQFKLFRIH